MLIKEALRASPYRRATRVHYDQNEKYYVTVKLSRDNDGEELLCGYCNASDGQWLGGAPTHMIRGHRDWEPEGAGNGLERAAERLNV